MQSTFIADLFAAHQAKAQTEPKSEAAVIELDLTALGKVAGGMGPNGTWLVKQCGPNGTW